MAVELSDKSSERTPIGVEVPAPTPWPIVLAFGITLLFAGLVTSGAVSVLGAVISISGADKESVGQFAADVRSLKKPEPYKGKGIRYAGEQVKIKPGKAFAGAGAK